MKAHTDESFILDTSGMNTAIVELLSQLSTYIKTKLVWFYYKNQTGVIYYKNQTGVILL